MQLSNRLLANAALAGLGGFPVIVVALHLVQRGSYHPLHQALSELALGRGGWAMWIAFCAAGTGMLCLAVLHRRLVAGSVAAPILLSIACVLSYVSAAFHADPDGVSTRHGTIHQTAGIVEFVLIVVAMFVSARRFRRDERWRQLARPTIVWAACAVVGFFLIPTLGNSLFGLAQRIFIATWLSWLLYLAAQIRASEDAVPATLPLEHAETTA
jgi:multisubunit Na+/H+ antiporter MnhB subunit